MNALKVLCRWIDRFNEQVGRMVAWVSLGLVMVIFVDVTMRYIFNTSFVFTQELEWHLFAFIFLIGAGYTLLLEVYVEFVYDPGRVSGSRRHPLAVYRQGLHTGRLFSVTVTGNLHGNPQPAADLGNRN